VQTLLFAAIMGKMAQILQKLLDYALFRGYNVGSYGYFYLRKDF
jgi:hypothetical protein